MRRLWIPVVALLVSLLGGCVSVPPQARGLKDVTRGDAIVLDERVSFTEPVGLLHIRWRISLQPGIYRAVQESAMGVFYRGEGYSTVLERLGSDGTVKNPVLYRVGGVWIPNDTSQSMRIYFYVQGLESTGKSLADVDPKSVAQPTNIPRGAPNVIATPSGPPTGPSLAGGVIGGMVVGMLIQAEVGRIAIMDKVTPPADFSEKLLQSLQRTSAP